MTESNEVKLDEVKNKKIIAATVVTDRFELLKLGCQGVEEIQYHEAVGNGDTHFIDVIGTADGLDGLDKVRVRYFDVKAIVFVEER